MENIGNADLSYCVRQANACGMNTLLRRHADPNAKDHHGMTALMWAAWFGYAEFVEILLGENANPNLEGPSLTPLGGILSHPTALGFAQHGENDPPPFDERKEDIADYKKVINLLNDQ